MNYISNLTHFSRCKQTNFDEITPYLEALRDHAKGKWRPNIELGRLFNVMLGFNFMCKSAFSLLFCLWLSFSTLWLIRAFYIYCCLSVNVMDDWQLNITPAVRPQGPMFVYIFTNFC